MGNKVIPKQYSDDSYGMKVGKGLSNDKTKHLFSWNAVNNCVPHKCPARDECCYEKIGKCSVQMKYLRAVEKVIFKNYLEILGEEQLFRIGMHLLPMYKTLSRLMIEELGVAKIIYKDKQGKKIVHPIYKEIRETIKSVEGVWKSLNLKPVPLPTRKKNARKGIAIME